MPKEPLKVVQAGEDLYISKVNSMQIELQVGDTAIYADIDAIEYLIDALRKFL